MIYIHCALLSEASLIIESFNLIRSKDSHFSIYENNHIILIISGIGKIESATAIGYLLAKYKAEKSDKIYNIGICTSTNEKYKIGAFYQINKIIDRASDKVYHLADKDGLSITCVDKALDNKNGIKTPLADMESSGFYLCAKKFIKSEHIFIYKIISDMTDSTIPSSNDIKVLLERQSDTIRDILS